MKKRELPLGEVYRLIEPGPVALITTANKDKTNVMAQAWRTMIDFEPPIIGLIISDRSYSFELIKATKELVINIPTSDLAKKVIAVGSISGKKTDKFKRYGLTPAPSKTVRPPLVEECFANLECKVIDAKLAGKYNMFIVEVKKAWIDPSVKNPKTLHHRGKGLFMVGGNTIKLPLKMA